MASVGVAELRATADPNQHTVQVQGKDILLWRQLLIYRYYEDLGSNENLDVIWTDYNKHSIVAIHDENPDSLISKIQKKDLFKSTVVTKTNNLNRLPGTPSAPLLRELGWVTLEQKRKLH